LAELLGNTSLAAQLAPPMMGADGSRDYFMGFQTNAEARRTGGLLGGFGVLHFDNGKFTVDDSLRTVVAKLVRRHPHVFRDDGRVHDAESKQRAPSAEAALDRWNSQKAQERADSGQRHTTLGSVPKSLPSLLRAYKIGKRVATVGFEWATAKDVVTKIEEEVAELRETLEMEPDNAARAEEEMGDLLFAIANLSRRLGIEPEAALRKANEKFTTRFNQMEQNFEASGRTLDAATLDEMEAEWQKIKTHEQ